MDAGDRSVELGEPDHCAALLGGEPPRREVGVVIEPGADDLVALRPLAGERTCERKVERRHVGAEDDAVRVRTEQPTDAVPRVLDDAGRGARCREEPVSVRVVPRTQEVGERDLEALDMIDRVVRLAISAGCERVEKIEIKLDPRLTSRQGVGSIERTRVVFALSGKSAPMVQLLSLSQGAPSSAGSAADTASGTTPLLIEKSEMQPRQNKPDEAALDVTFVVARLAPGS